MRGRESRKQEPLTPNPSPRSTGERGAYGTVCQTLVNGSSIFSVSGLSAGDHALVASYQAQGVYAASTTTSSIHVNPATLTYQIGDDTQNYGSPANLAADLPDTIATGVYGENLVIDYASNGDTPTAQPGSYPITGTLSNGTGLLSNYNVTLLSGTLTVYPTPSVTVEVPSDGVAYQPRNFTFTGGGAAGDLDAGYTYNINWGDGSPVQTVPASANNSTVTVAHIFTSTATFTSSVTASDQYGVSSPSASQAITIGLAGVQADGSGQGGITGLAISGISGATGLVLSPTGVANTLKVTRNGTNLETFVATNGNVAIYGDGRNDLVTIDGVANSSNTFTLTGSTATLAAASLSPNVFTIALNSINSVTMVGGTAGNSFTNTAATVASVLSAGAGGTNSFTFAGSTMGAAATIKGAGSSNTLFAPTLAANQGNLWSITGTNAGTLNGSSWSFSGMQNLAGGATIGTSSSPTIGHPDDTPTGEVLALRYALRPLNYLHGKTLARYFGPSALKAVRELLVRGYDHPKYERQKPICRNQVNSRVKRIRRLFKWAVEEELIPASVHHRLCTVSPLTRMRGESQPDSAFGGHRLRWRRRRCSRSRSAASFNPPPAQKRLIRWSRLLH